MCSALVANGKVLCVGLLSTIARIVSCCHIPRLNSPRADSLSPGGHCRHFAPTMEKLVKAHRRLENTRGFHMAQVNCVAQGDLCNDNGIKYYPMIKLYEDGVEKETYAGDRSFENLNDYIEKQSLEYVLEHGKRLATGGKGVDGESVRGVNEDGEVKELGVESLAQLIKDGPAYVKFMAPWCGQ